MDANMNANTITNEAPGGFIPAAPSSSRKRASSGAELEPGAVFAEAHDLGLRSPLGCPYAGMDVVVYQGELTALRGRNGSGKTALLLTLAGRMAHTEGTLVILGETMPRGRGRVQRRVGLGLVPGVNDLQENLSVHSVTAAEFELYGKSPKRDAVDEYLKAWGLGGVARMKVGELSRERLVELGVALAMVNNPIGVAVDDIEDQLTIAQSDRLMNMLARLAHERGVAVMVACTERSLAATADRTYDLS